MIIIYPNDSTTQFLSGIVNRISSTQQIKIDCPQLHLQKHEDTVYSIKNSDSSRTIVYLGHGTEYELNGGMDSTFSTSDGRYMFKGKKILLISCNSAGFINSLKNQFEVGIGFGNIPSSVAEFVPGKREKYGTNDSKCLTLFKDALVRIFADSLIETFQNNETFQQLYYSIKLRINKIICLCALSKDVNEQLLGELLLDLKNEMRLVGNRQRTIN
jgi:hypothetical protein